MLLDDILKDLRAKGLRSMQTRFVSAPQDEPFVVWDVAASASGADLTNTVRTYEASLILVEHQSDGPCAREAIEEALDLAALPWTRQMREWNEDEHVYITEYTFTWVEKARCDCRLK